MSSEKSFSLGRPFLDISETINALSDSLRSFGPDISGLLSALASSSSLLLSITEIVMKVISPTAIRNKKIDMIFVAVLINNPPVFKSFLLMPS